jgi:hypothetical protein
LIFEPIPKERFVLPLIMRESGTEGAMPVTVEPELTEVPLSLFSK